MDNSQLLCESLLISRFLKFLVCFGFARSDSKGLQIRSQAAFEAVSFTFPLQFFRELDD